MTERGKEKWKKMKTSETKRCAVNKTFQLYFVERRFFPPDRSLGIYFEWWVEILQELLLFRIIVFSSCFCFCMLTINHCWYCSCYQWDYDLTSDYDLPMTEQCAGTTNVFERVQHNVKTKKEHNSFFIVSHCCTNRASVCLAINSSNNEPRCWITSNLTFPFDHEHILTLTVTLCPTDEIFYKSQILSSSNINDFIPVTICSINT